MQKYSFSADKALNKWPDPIYDQLADKNTSIENLITSDTVKLFCPIHGEYNKTVKQMYADLNIRGHLRCYKCGRLAAAKHAQETSMKRYGTKVPSQNPEIYKKIRQTNLERYGYEVVTSSPEFMKKQRETNMKKYGVPYVILNPKIKAKANKVMLEKYGTIHALQNKDSANKFKDTMMNRYHVNYGLQSKELYDKFTDTMKEKYQVEHALQNEDIKQKMIDTNTERYNSEFVSQTYNGYCKIQQTKNRIPVSEDIFNIVNNKELFSNYIDTFTINEGHSPTIVDLSSRLGFGKSTIGQKIILHGLQDKIKYLGGESYGEYEIMDFLDQYNIKYKHRYKKLGPEIDIFIPKCNIGIEFNGLYWHSDIYKEKKYHYNKKKYYQDIGINIINIYDDEWADDNTQDIIKSIILSSCNISNNKSIEYARKLKLVEFDHDSYSINKIREFFDENHLQGYRTASIYVALVDNDDDIIECMSFGYPYFGNKNNDHKYQYELIRHCSKIYHNVVGGKERIFKHFIQNHPYDSSYDNYILTYCDIDKFNGNSYLKLGFQYIGHKLQVWGVTNNYTKRIFRNPNNNAVFKDLPKIYGCGNNVYAYNKKGNDK